MKTRKKGQLGSMPTAVILLVVVAIVAGAGAIVLSQFNSTTSVTQANEVIGDGLTGLTTFGDFIPTIAIVIAAVVVIGLVLAGFLRSGRSAGSSF